LVVVTVLVAGGEVVAVLVPVPVVVGVVPGAVVVVVVGAVVVVVDELFFWCVVVVVVDLLAAFFDGELDPHAAATSPPARTMVPMSHRFPVRRPDGVSVASGLTRLNTYCSSPRCGARCRQTQGATHLSEHSYRGNLNGIRRNGKLPVSRG